MNTAMNHSINHSSDETASAQPGGFTCAPDWQSYPTPEALAVRAWRKFKSPDVERLLDACAGAGALADQWSSLHDQGYRGGRGGRHEVLPVDVIEVDARHHPTLREKHYNVVGLDFLQFEGGSIYSHVIMNPPFAQGARHALKAWDMLWEGEVVAILNAETLRNPFSAERKRLASLVAAHGSVEYIRDAFVGADSNLSHRADRILSQGWKPTLRSRLWTSVGPGLFR